MRSWFYPILTLIAILLVGVGFLLLRPGGWWPEGTRILSGLLSTPAPANQTQATPPPTSAAASKPARKGVVSGKQQQDNGVEQPGTITAVATSPTPKKYPFPLADEIAAGTPRATILAKFGRPEVTVTGTDHGEFRERYVYLDRTTDRKTYISIINSIVTSAQTSSQF